MADAPTAERYETARRFGDQLSSHFEVDVQVTWATGPEGETWTARWTDGPPPDRTVVDVAKAVARDLGGVRGRLQARRVLSPWAWFWALRNAQADGTLPRSADEAVDRVGAELVAATVPPPSHEVELHLAGLVSEEAPPLALAQFVIDQTFGVSDHDETPGPLGMPAVTDPAVSSPVSNRIGSAQRSDSRDETTGGAGGEPQVAATADPDPGSVTGDETDTAPSLQDTDAGSVTGDETTGCEHCGGPRPSSQTGRPARFCSTRCRQAAHRAAQRDPASTTERHCGRCQKPLDVKPRPGRQRLWCSDTCRVAASRDRRSAVQRPTL